MPEIEAVGPYEPSILRIRFKDQGMQLVGTPEQPLALRVDGDWRIWPGSEYRLRQKQPDGTWRDVVWAPGADS